MTQENLPAKTGSLLPKQAEEGMSTMSTGGSFIAPLKLTYKTSRQFEEEKAKIGDFFLGDASLGTELKVVALGYKYKAIAIKNKSTFVESLELLEDPNFKRFPEREEYIAFQKKHNADKDVEISSAIELLLFLPEHNLFCGFFAKNKLHPGAMEMLKNSTGREIQLVKSQVQSNKSQTLKWITLGVSLTGETIDVPGKDQQLEIFKQKTEIADDNSAKEESGRKR